ncbi:MAG: CPn0927/CPn0928 family alpha/beta hydrolase fold protein [Rhabdochlamydiaceae bacterium]
MITCAPSFQEQLGGPHAFYNQKDYEESTKKDLSQTNHLPTTYEWNTDSKIITIARLVFQILFFPLAIYRGLHILAAKIAILPSSSPWILDKSKGMINDIRSNTPLDEEWKYKRLTIEVDGYKVDAVIVGKPKTLQNGQWTLFSNGNAQFYEYNLHNYSQLREFLTLTNSNALLFNYPGVGSSSSLPSKEAMTKAYRSMLTFLEDDIKGIGAKKIIGYGLSIGGAVQAEALNQHVLKSNIKYVFVKDRTFSDLSLTASLLTTRVLGFLVLILGWKMQPALSSKKLKAPEIIIQTAQVKKYTKSPKPSKIIDDGVIHSKASLATALLEDTTCSKTNKLFIGVPDQHNDYLSDLPFLANEIIANLNK